MEIVGRGNGLADRFVWEDDYLTVSSLLGLAARLEATDHGEQFLFREVELDCAFRQADSMYEESLRSNDPSSVGKAKAIRELVFEIHDLCGLQSMTKAALRANDLAELIAGIE